MFSNNGDVAPKAQLRKHQSHIEPDNSRTAEVNLKLCTNGKSTPWVDSTHPIITMVLFELSDDMLEKSVLPHGWSARRLKFQVANVVRSTRSTKLANYAG